MAKREENLSWQEVDPETLQPEVAKAFAAYKLVYAEARERRMLFEEAATEAAELPATHRLAFSYNFGKLSIAVAAAKPASKAGSKAVDFKSIKVA